MRWLLALWLMLGVANAQTCSYDASDSLAQVFARCDAALFGKADTATAVPSGGLSGQVLVKNSDTNYDLAWKRHWDEALVKPIDTTIASNTTLADDGTMSVSVLANTNYVCRGTLFLGASSVSGYKIGINGPASPTAVRAYLSLSSTSSTTITGLTQTTYGAFIGFTPASNQEVAGVLNVVLNNGANAGNLAVQFAQNVSSATVLTVRSGSYFECRMF